MTKREVRARRGARIALPTGPAGQTSGETVAAALARKNRRPEPYEQVLGRFAGIAVRAGQLLWTAALGTDMPATTLAVFRQSLTGWATDPPVMPPELTARTIRTELGAPPPDLFAEFEPAPFATGALCQTHHAVLPDGRRAAVRIRYRGAAQAVRTALAGDEVRTLVLTLAPETTGAGLRRVASELRGRVEESIGLRAARIPYVVTELSTPRVLTHIPTTPEGSTDDH